MFNLIKKLLVRSLIVVVLLYSWNIFFPLEYVIPVKNATESSYNKDSFWFYPWGTSVTHKGVDIFSKKGESVLSSSHSIVLFTGYGKKSGNFILTLDPSLKLQYYAHLESINTSKGKIHYKGEKIGSVGNTGNASGKPFHLHFSIVTCLPHFWLMDTSPHGYFKSFYLNPIQKFTE